MTRIEPALATALATTAITSENIGLLLILGAGVGAVIAVVTWIEKKIERRINDHEEAEFAKFTMREQLDAQRHENLMAEIRHVKELVDIDGQIKKLRRDIKGEAE